MEDVSFRVDPGEVVGLLGPNGAGKSTCFDLVMGLARPARGRVLLGDRDVTRWPPHRRARLGLGYLAQEPSVFHGLTVRENVLAVLELGGLPRAERLCRADALLSELDLAAFADRRAERLSGGERRRTEIARVLAGDPRVLLLDEPFSGVDPRSVADLRTRLEGLRARGIGLLVADHAARDLLPMCDRAVLLLSGRIAFEGSVEALLASELARQAWLGPDFQL